jgi:hypothetical protein
MALTRLDYLSTAFTGCECIATIDSVYYGGPIEIYELRGMDKRAYVGAWYPDGALQLWPMSTYFKLEEKGDVLDAPHTPRNKTQRLDRNGQWEAIRNPLKGHRLPEADIQRRPLVRKKIIRRR